jgi:hypothetical protein
MRLTCGSAVVGCVLTHRKLILAARGPPETGFEPGVDVDGTCSSLRNSRISLSAGRRACKPAAKPAILGAVLLHYGFVCYERTRPLPLLLPAPAPEPHAPLGGKRQWRERVCEGDSDRRCGLRLALG